jgi:crotonobetainyl-CoA:carnitine CoA-transferase CaiB-like acyl-CoA transferase
MWEDRALTIHLLEDERFATPEDMIENREVLSGLLDDIIIKRSSDEWIEIFNSMQVDVNRIGFFEELLDDPQVIQNKMVIPHAEDAPVSQVVTHPIRITSVPQVPPKRAPELGEHSEQILQELGYSEKTIAEMKENGVI